ETIRRAWDRSNLIVTTGGLGPTQDDLTREAIAEMLGEQMIVDAAMEQDLRRFFASRGSSMPESNIKQAMLIPSSDALRNPVGSAPGWWVQRGNGSEARIIVSMPGVPYEMERMWTHEVEPRLRQLSGGTLYSRTLKVLGLGESRVDELVGDLMKSADPTLAPYAKKDGVHLRITTKATSAMDHAAKIEGMEQEIRRRLGDAVYGIDDETPGGVVVRLLNEVGLRIALLEVGEGALGSTTPLLGTSACCCGAIDATDLNAAARLLGSDDEPTLAGLSERLRVVSGADVVLAVQVRTGPGTPGTTSVSAHADLLVLPRSGEMQETRQAWRTSETEVTRIVGLAAVNALRLYLISARMDERR
ncbi:MAG TPA: molybdopterin-binding protein, partial [Chloroflexia bacterium]|nr:molybdopterin-binding protein [Chloroflexia bacterium]